MKKAIFKNFIIILILALLFSGSIFSIVISDVLLDKTKVNMLNILQIMDQSLDYDSDLGLQINELNILNDHNKARLTILDSEGNVIVDNQVSEHLNMENHLQRKEIQKALKEGYGSARRRSGTLNKSMLYVSYMSKNKDYILRIAMPFNGYVSYLVILLPSILLSLGITLILSLILANRFSSTITKPLYEISEELLKLKEDNPEFSFKPYEYSELNLIGDTTKRMADAVKQSMKKIEFERMVRQEFFTNASHELKTPITSIRGYIELLENNMATNEEMKKEFMARIKKEALNMTVLIDDILMISRLETKEVEVVITQVRICPLVTELVASLKPLAGENDVTIEMNCKPITINANHGQMKDLFSNLIVNAIKYNKPGGKVKIIVTKEGNNAIFIVEDTGVGIPDKSKQRIFERFYRVDKGRSKKMGGTGLGLSIVKHIVNYYNGTIEFDSQIGKGTKFTVRIPID
ncbi:MAG: GHKL domain-containing protein [Clostridiales bacterium]|jgi:two-component system phosphate regulon sensor histidine kinase PhoR|nr:ATP-binding protein [Bacillota bacterium]NLK04351.1 GHKL domain-containing protein [Clostridiales bacterium]